MIFSVCKPQYFISHTKSERSLVTQHRQSCEKVNLHYKLETWAWVASPQMSFGVRSSRIHFSPTDVRWGEMHA